jgi:hypothetical protein
MTDKVHGFSHTPDQFLSGGLKMFTVTVTGVDMTAKTTTPASGAGGMADVSTESHSPDFDKVVEIISTRAQPVIMGAVSATTFNFAVEHNDIFATNGKLDDYAQFNAEGTAALSAYKPGATFTLTPFTF